MEFLLEFEEHKRALVVQEGKLSSELLITISKEVESLRDLSGVVVSLAHAHDKSDFFLQVWSCKWNSFIDLKDVKNVCGGDRLKMVRRSIPNNCSEKVCKARAILHLSIVCPRVGLPGDLGVDQQTKKEGTEMPE